MALKTPCIKERKYLSLIRRKVSQIKKEA